MPKKGPKLNLKQQNPDPPPSVPNLPPDLDKKASITVGQVIFEIEADDLEVICELGRSSNFSESRELQHFMALSSVQEAIAIFYDNNFFDIKVKYPI